MVKTEKQIESDIYDIVANSALASAVNGRVYRKGLRPDKSVLEDIVVKFLSGFDNQVQSGVVIVNIYVPDVPFGGYSSKIEDEPRVSELQTIVNEVIENLSDNEYDIEKNGTPTSLQADGIEQHFIYVRLNFRRITD